MRAWAGRHLLAVVLVAHVLLTAVLAVRALESGYSGDELAYVDGARALSNAVRDVVGLHAVDVASLRTDVVGNGWFMPGPSLALTPLFLLVPEASLVVVRVYLLVLVNLLFLGAVGSVDRTLGRRCAVLVAAFPGLVPVWVLFSFTAWGDLAAGLVVLLMVTHLVRIGRGLVAGAAPTPGQTVGLGLLGATALYLRSNTLPLVAGVLVLVLLGGLLRLRGRVRLRSVAGAVLAGAVVLGALVPWSVGASLALGAPVTTTTSVPMALAVTFGDPDRPCFGPCEGENPWFAYVSYARSVAARTGESEVVVQQEMAAYALEGLTPDHYARQVVDDVGRYVFAPTEMLDRFPGSPAYVAAVRVGTDVVYGVFALAWLAGLVLVRGRRTVDDALLRLLLTCVTLALLVQPFLHVSTGRYWPLFAPVMALSASLLWRSPDPSAPTPATGAEPAPTALLLAQRLGVGLLAVVALGLGVVGWVLA